MIACLAAIAVTGLDWGLPSTRNDGYLFNTQVWRGSQIAALAGDRPAGAAADVDRNPVVSGEAPVVLNATDSDRAAILRRFRLYSHQPDEMITFMSLADMKPAQGQLDPKLYQYGGLWIYPVGVMLKAASALGVIDLRSDKAFYYDHPGAFGRFYVVARSYALLWYVVAMACAAAAIKQLTDDDLMAVVAAATVGVLPVTFAMAHEAKPHIVGTALTLAAVLAAAKWVRTGRWRDAIFAGALVGAAAGSVLTAATAVVLLPVMALLRHDGVGRRIGAATVALAIAAAVYAATNPYVVLHAIHGDAVLGGNLSNTKAMYGIGDLGQAATDAGERLLEALSWPVAAVAVMSVIVFLFRKRRPSPIGWLLTTAAVVTLVPFVLFAAGKPAEYARFALLPAVAIGILCVWAISVSIARPWLRTGLAATLPVAIFIAGTLPYFRAFAIDTSAQPGDIDTRRLAAAALERIGSYGATLQVYADPAPYCMPPVDLSNWRIVLTRPDAPPIGAAIVRPIDDPGALPSPPAGYMRQTIVGSMDRPAPITWANKPFELLIRQ